MLSKNKLSKRCAKCRRWWPLINYTKRTASKDGYKAQCKTCIISDRRAVAPTKHCKRCDTFKPRTKFHKNKSRKDGLSTYCASCMRKATVKYRPTNKCISCDAPYSINRHPDPMHCPTCSKRKAIKNVSS